MAGFLAGIIGMVGLGLVFIAQSVAMFGTVTPMVLLVFALYGALVLPAAVIGGTLGGAFGWALRKLRKPS
jgi:hypothetical protein